MTTRETARGLPHEWGKQTVRQLFITTRYEVVWDDARVTVWHDRSCRVAEWSPRRGWVLIEHGRKFWDRLEDADKERLARLAVDCWLEHQSPTPDQGGEG